MVVFNSPPFIMRWSDVAVPGAVPNPLSELIINVPDLTRVVPVKVLIPFNINAPWLDFRFPDPVIIPP